MITGPSYGEVSQRASCGEGSLGSAYRILHCRLRSTAGYAAREFPEECSVYIREGFVAWTEIREVELPNGQRIFVELDVPPAGDTGFRGREPLAWARLQDQIVTVSRWVIAAAQEAVPEKPSRYTVSFGVRLALETGNIVGVLAKASGEATVSISVEWEAQHGKENSVVP
jgi:Trypsin-co-occurring domain 1